MSQAIPGVPKIKNQYNPATWMLEVSSTAVELRQGIDFAEHYKNSTLCKRNQSLVKECSTPTPGANDLYFPARYSQSFFGQFRSCLWKQKCSYWRNPEYNCVRILSTIIIASIFGSIFWKAGKNRRDNNVDLISILGGMYASVMFIGALNSQTVQPVVSIERTVFYRERAAGMYSAMPYALAQVAIEIPYVIVQTIAYTILVYSMIGFEWVARKFLLFLLISFLSFLYFTYYGMMAVSVTPNQQMAAVVGAAFYSLFNLFSGFFIPRKKIPKYWIWYYWMCPLAWSVYGLVVSQYGDVTDLIEVDGKKPGLPVNQYVEEIFGYNKDFMGPVAVVLVVFTVFFAFMFAFCIKVLNFQNR